MELREQQRTRQILAAVASRGSDPGAVRSPRRARSIFLALLFASLAACATTPPPQQTAYVPPPAEPAFKSFEATAYTIEGKTASGTKAREGICAADPSVLPIGSRIRVHDAGPYSGEYLVSDTGRTIKGQEIDIYIANDAEAKKFGRKNVRVEVLSSAK